jgi:hypothetical protein
MDLETFLKQKIENFSNFIKEVIGVDNKIYIDLQKYKNNLEEFMRLIITLSVYAKKDKDNIFFEKDAVFKFLETNNIDAQNTKLLDKDNFDKLNRYLNMFVNVLC